MNPLDQLITSPPLTSWLLISAAAMARLGVAGLFAGNSFLFRPINPNRVDRSEPARTVNEHRVRRRALEVLAAGALGWFPGLLVEGLVGRIDPRMTIAVVTFSIVASVIYLVAAMRRFEREGRERYTQRVVAEESERLNSAA
jgi:hypothetical protein